MPNPTDRRRLKDGAKAKALPKPKTLPEMKEHLSVMFDGMLALQSLDDLGSPEANQRAWDDLIELQRRFNTLKSKVKRIDSKKKRAGRH